MKPSANALRLVFGATLVSSVSCVVDIEPAATVSIVCDGDAACPSGQACLAGLGVCRPIGASCVEATASGYGAADDGTACDRDDGASGVCVSARCLVSSCGDGVRAESEGCDDGTANSDERADACRTTCEPASCGDGVRDADEACDDGTANSDTLADACRTDCRAPRCGDGVEDLDETCDQGPDNANDGVCTSVCLLQICGDGFVGPGESCDAGGPSGACDDDCTPAQCGDDHLNTVAGEECDGGGESVDCDLNCTEVECGDLTVNTTAGEDCDLGLANSDAPNAACRTDCLFRRCGDGVVDTLLGEDCEAGVALGTTCTGIGYYEGELGCSSCLFSGCNLTCGDGAVNGPELCDGDAATPESCASLGYDAGGLVCSNVCSPDFSPCVRFNWPVKAVGGTDWNDLWISDTGRVFAVGELGGVATAQLTDWSSGSVADWTLLDSGTTQPLYAVWGFADDEVYAVGGGGLILRYDGSWQVVRAASGANQPLKDVHGVDHIVYAVGYNATVVRVDGGGFTNETTGAASNVDFTGVFARRADEIFVAGQSPSSGRLWRKSGGSWGEIDLSALTPAVDDVASVWASGRHLFLGGSTSGQEGVVYRYDGSTWTVDLVDSTFVGHVTGYSAHDVYAFGSKQSHFDGFHWRQLGGSSLNLHNAGAGDNVLLGLGNVLRRGARVHLAAREFADLGILTVAAGASDQAFVAGIDPGAFSGSISRFDGDTWSTPQAQVGASSFRSLVVTSPEEAFATDSNGVWRYNGASWAAMPASPVASLVVGSDGTNVYAASFSTVHRYDGSGWSVALTIPDGWINAIELGAPGEVWVMAQVDPELRLYRSNGGPWTHQVAPSSLDPRDLFVSPEGHVFIVGAGGVYGIFDGATWRTGQVMPALDLYALWGTSRYDVYASAAQGLFHFDGTQWAPIALETGSHFWGLDGVPGRRLWAAGEDGTFASELVDLTLPFGNTLACGAAARAACSDEDIAFQQMFGGTNDFIQVVNRGCCRRDLGGDAAASIPPLTISARGSCNAEPVTYTFPEESVLLPGGVLRAMDITSGLGPNERAAFSDFCDHPGTPSWAALCRGPCDLATCANVLDYVGKRSGATQPTGAPTCATMLPDLVDVAPLPTTGDSTWSLVRRSYYGRGPTAARQDWQIGTTSRE